MNITQEFAENFAGQWIRAWNQKDIEAIMSHYATGVVFSSPFVLKTQFNLEGVITGKNELRKYFEMALEKNKGLHFSLQHTMVGVKSITLIYLRKNTILASEVMILDDKGLVIEGLSHYPVNSIYNMS